MDYEKINLSPNIAGKCSHLKRLIGHKFVLMHDTDPKDTAAI